MKKLVILFFAFSMMQLSAQTLSSASKSDSTGSITMLEKLASDQVVSLAKKLSLNEKQVKQVSGLVMTHLKTQKFQKIIGSDDTVSLKKSVSTDELTEKIQTSLLLDKEFQESMLSILDSEQMKTMSHYTPK